MSLSLTVRYKDTFGQAQTIEVAGAAYPSALKLQNYVAGCLARGDTIVLATAAGETLSIPANNVLTTTVKELVSSEQKKRLIQG